MFCQIIFDVLVELASKAFQKAFVLFSPEAKPNLLVSWDPFSVQIAVKKFTTIMSTAFVLTM